MNIRRTIKLTGFVAITALAATACTQAVDDSTGASSNAASGTTSGASTTDEAGHPKRPMMLLADVVDKAGTHALVPFVLPEPKAGPPPADGDATKAPPPCLVHRTTADEASAIPSPPPRDPKTDGAPPMPPPDGAPAAGDAKPGPVLLQIAVFANEADATAGAPTEGTAPKLPVVVVQCFGAPGEKRVDVPKAVLDDAFAGLADGAIARIALAGFPMPPPPKDGAAPKEGAAPPPPAPAPGATGGAPLGPPPPIGRGIFALAKVSDTSLIDSLLSTLALP